MWVYTLVLLLIVSLLLLQLGLLLLPIVYTQGPKSYNITGSLSGARFPLSTVGIPVLLRDTRCMR